MKKVESKKEELTQEQIEFQEFQDAKKAEQEKAAAIEADKKVATEATEDIKQILEDKELVQIVNTEDYGKALNELAKFLSPGIMKQLSEIKFPVLVIPAKYVTKPEEGQEDS